MGMVKRLLENYVEAMHPYDYDAQDELMTDICEGRVQVPLEEMSAVVKNHNSFFGYDDVTGKVYRFVSDYQRSLWLKLNPDHRNTVDSAHMLVRRVKEWRLLENDTEEGVA